MCYKILILDLLKISSKSFCSILNYSNLATDLHFGLKKIVLYQKNLKNRSKIFKTAAKSFLTHRFLNLLEYI